MSNLTVSTNLGIEEVFAGIVVITLGTVGSITSIIVIIQIIRTPVFHTAFGYICVSNLIADSIELLINALWAGPAILLRLDASITHSFVGERFGQLILFFWFAIIYSHMQIAINRMVAIAWPMRYSEIFTGRKLVYFISIFWILSFVHALLYSRHVCSAWFDAIQFRWTFPPRSCANGGYFYLSFTHGMTTSLLIFSINTVTFICIWKKMRVQSQSNGSEQQMSLLRKNIRLYVQGCISSTITVLTTISFHFLSPLAKTRMELFVATTVIWEITHMSDGVILIIFNKPLRTMLFQPHQMLKKAKSKLGTVVTQSNTAP